MVSLKCSWIRKLYDENFHPWKIIPLHLIEMYSGINVKFHPNLNLREFSLMIFPKYYQEIIHRWSKYLSSPTSLLSSIASPIIWLNKDTKIGNKCVLFSIE